MNARPIARQFERLDRAPDRQRRRQQRAQIDQPPRDEFDHERELLADLSPAAGPVRPRSS